MLAAQEGHMEVGGLLLEVGANPDTAATAKIDGWTLPVFTARNGRAAFAELFAESGTDVQKRTATDATALTFTVMCGHECIVAMLIEEGADLDAQDEDDDTPLILSVMEGRPWRGERTSPSNS